MHAFLLFGYLKWHYFDSTKAILKAWGNILWFNFNYFSVLLLLKTFFAPWRRIVWRYERGFQLGSYLFIFASNLVSRIMGAIMRSFLIAAGIIAQMVLLLAAALFVLFWLAFPAIIGIAFFYGLFFLF